MAILLLLDKRARMQLVATFWPWIVCAALRRGGEKGNGDYGQEQDLLYHELLSLLSKRWLAAW